MSDSRPTSRNIPQPMQRAIRQRCGFGCVICGLPLYEYDHIEGWATTKEHIEEQITLLCDQHHKEKTNKLLPVEKVRIANAEPYNLKEGVTKPYDLHFSGKQAEVCIGNLSFTHPISDHGTVFIPLEIDGVAMVAFFIIDGHIHLNFVAFDEFNVPVLHIMNNQLVIKTKPWDVQLVGKRLTVREGPSKILMVIKFEPPNKITVERGRFLRNGVEVLVRPTNILVTNNSNVIIGPMSVIAERGFAIGAYENAPSCVIYVSDIPRYLGDNSRALRFERKCLKKARNHA